MADQNNQKAKKRTREPNGASSIYQGKDGKWHGRVTMGIRDDGKPDRRHIERKTKAEVVKAVRDLEREREAGTARKPGQRWTVEKWLVHWLENIAAPSLKQSSYSAYRTAVHVHLIPGLGAHRLEKLEPEHLERFYRKMQANGSKPATAHQVHRTIRTALNEALRRGHVARNVATLARAPRITEEEVEPYTVEEVQRLLMEASKHRNSARWAVALALGLRQGEALGLKWSDVDLVKGTLRVRQARQRPKYAHGCNPPCGRKNAGHCPHRRQTNAVTIETKSRAGKRVIGLPDELVKLLRLHREEQDRERTAARDLWVEGGWVFASETGEPLVPRTDWDRWKALLRTAGIRDGRLHDARHTAATVLLILGVSERAAMGIMGWSSTSMVARYQHMIDPVRQDIAKRIGGLIWKAAGESEAAAEDHPDGAAEDPADGPEQSN